MLILGYKKCLATALLDCRAEIVSTTEHYHMSSPWHAYVPPLAVSISLFADMLFPSWNTGYEPMVRKGKDGTVAVGYYDVFGIGIEGEFG